MFKYYAIYTRLLLDFYASAKTTTFIMFNLIEHFFYLYFLRFGTPHLAKIGGMTSPTIIFLQLLF